MFPTSRKESSFLDVYWNVVEKVDKFLPAQDITGTPADEEILDV